MARIRSDVRLQSYANGIATFPVTLDFDDAAMLRTFVTERLAKARAR